MVKHIASLGFTLFVTLVGSSLGSSQVSSSHLLRVGKNCTPTFVLPAVLVATSGTHTVKNGETLWGISRKYRVSYNELVKLNGLSSETDPIIKAGTRLKLPGSGIKATPKKKISSVRNGASHTVRPGETLYGIAQSYSISAQALQDANNMTNPKSLGVGQTLRIPNGGKQRPSVAPKPKRQAPPTPALTKTAPKPTTTTDRLIQSVAAPPSRLGSVPLGFALYQTEGGDTMAKIAERYRIPKAELLRINRRSSSPGYTPRLGELVMVPTDGSWYVPKSQNGAASIAQPTTRTKKQGARIIKPRTSMLIEHNVAPNDSLEALSQRFRTTVDQIRLDNPGVRSNRDLRVGSDLKIRVNSSL